MTAAWTLRKFTWLEAVAGDRLARGLPLACAVMLAVKYLNSETHDAWPALTTLVTAINSDRRTVQRALDRLVELGWLSRVRRERRTNVYRIAFRSSESGPYDARAARRSKGGLHDALGGGSDAAHIRESNPRVNEREGADAPAPSAPSEFSARRTGAVTSKPVQRRSVPLPAHWELGEPELAVAQEITDWPPDRVDAEFAAFQDWHRANRPASYDWLAAWTNWCRRGSEQRHSAPLTGVRSAVAGLRDWLEAKN
jgi:hypothetical protein